VILNVSTISEILSDHFEDALNVQQMRFEKGGESLT
jgi:hypothetical protein